MSITGIIFSIGGIAGVLIYIISLIKSLKKKELKVRIGILDVGYMVFSFFIGAVVLWSFLFGILMFVGLIGGALSGSVACIIFLIFAFEPLLGSKNR